MVVITEFTASLLSVQHEKDSVKNKPASSLVVSLGLFVERQTVVRFNEPTISAKNIKYCASTPLSNAIQINIFMLQC